MEIYDIGTKVTIKNIESKAIIRAICIEGITKNITYKCVWWGEKEVKKSEWLEEDEFEIINGNEKKILIGFK